MSYQEVFGIGNGQANNVGMSDISNTLDCLADPQKVMISCVGGVKRPRR